MLREIQEICGPFNHHGHVVADIEKAIQDYLTIGIGPWYFISKSRKDRWDAQVRAGGGKKGKLRATQLHYGEPTAYRALVAFGYNAETGIELIQPYNDEPSCHNDWLKSRGNGLQHINFTVPRERYVELIGKCLDAGWVPSLQLIEGEWQTRQTARRGARTCRPCITSISCVNLGSMSNCRAPRPWKAARMRAFRGPRQAYMAHLARDLGRGHRSDPLRIPQSTRGFPGARTLGVGPAAQAPSLRANS